METTAQKVRQFKSAVGQPMAQAPGPVDQSRVELHLNMLAAEMAELVGALCGLSEPNLKELKLILRAEFAFQWENSPRSQDLTGIARNGVDLSYVTSSLLLEAGINEDEVTDLVHGANVAKAGGPLRDDGKQLPPEGWEPPDVAGYLGRKLAENGIAEWPYKT